VKLLKKKILEALTALSLGGAALAVVLALLEEAPQLEEELAVSELQKRCVTESVGSQEDGTPLGYQIDFEALKAVNEDIIGWIYIPDTQVNQPVLQHASDNSYYLHHSFENKENVLGSIYLYNDSAADFTDPHTVLFGHNMASGQMFGGLSQYSGQAFMESHREVYLYLPGRSMRCQVYSAYSCSVYDRTYLVPGAYGTEQYREWIRHTGQQSGWNSESVPSDEDQVITLSTCTDDRDASRRFVVNCYVTESRDQGETI
jgi:sortase B